ncbi:MAG: trypsin-like peptidase domain-containing protein, partial [Allosphingosinicella sp.]
TSFAVATTAGCAALWLGHHGPAEVRAVADARGSNVQELFRAALRQSARRPGDWPDNMGAGIVDAEALLALDLAAIADVAPPPGGHPLRAMVGEDFDWERFGAEAAFLAFDRAQRSDPERAMAMESPVSPRPSPALAAALRDAGQPPDALFGAPGLRSPLTPELSPGRALRIVAGGASGAGSVESAGGGLEMAAARSYLEGEGGAALATRLEAVLGARTPPGEAGGDVSRLRDQILESAPAAIDALARGARPERLSLPQRIAVEALVRLTGRPALRIVDGQVDPQHPEIGDWFADLWGRRQELKPLFDAVGRIDLEQDGTRVHYGSGTVVAPGVVMTNRHVVDALAEPIPAAGGGTEFMLLGPVTIAFDEDGSRPERRFEISGVIAAGPDRIGNTADVARLDMALLAMKADNGHGGVAPAPAPVPVTGLAQGVRPRLAVVGYPARPGQSAVIDPDTGQTRLDAWDRLWEIYQNRYGEKYVSPGEVEVALGALPGDPRHWGFSHDATTLPGNSGSSIISLETLRIFGLHFGGAPLRQNLAHGLSAVREASAGGGLIDTALFDAMSWA